jgi:hypothetical protein
MRAEDTMDDRCVLLCMPSERNRQRQEERQKGKGGSGTHRWSQRGHVSGVLAPPVVVCVNVSLSRIRIRIILLLLHLIVILLNSYIAGKIQDKVNKDMQKSKC